MTKLPPDELAGNEDDDLAAGGAAAPDLVELGLLDEIGERPPPFDLAAIAEGAAFISDDPKAILLELVRLWNDRAVLEQDPFAAQLAIALDGVLAAQEIASRGQNEEAGKLLAPIALAASNVITEARELGRRGEVVRARSQREWVDDCVDCVARYFESPPWPAYDPASDIARHFPVLLLHYFPPPIPGGVTRETVAAASVTDLERAVRRAVLLANTTDRIALAESSIKALLRAVGMVGDMAHALFSERRRRRAARMV